MLREENIRAILECNFAGYKEEIIENAVKRICELEQEPCVDAISRVEVLEQINCWIGSGEYRHTNATWYLGNRIKDLPSVQPKDVLDKIITEIEHLTITEGGEDYIRKMAELYSLKIKVLQIIDKYRLESESSSEKPNK